MRISLTLLVMLFTSFAVAAPDSMSESSHESTSCLPKGPDGVSIGTPHYDSKGGEGNAVNWIDCGIKKPAQAAAPAAPAAPSVPTSCAASVNTHVTCSEVNVSQIPFNISCGDVYDSQKMIPFTSSSACTYSTTQQMVTTVTCKRNVRVSCDPCAGAPCPQDMPMVRGHNG